MHRFLNFGIHDNAFTITQNSLILQLGGTPVGALPCTPAGGTAPRPSTPPLARSSRSATDWSNPVYWTVLLRIDVKLGRHVLHTNDLSVRIIATWQ